VTAGRGRSGTGPAEEVARSWDARADRYLKLFRDELDGQSLPHGAIMASARPAWSCRSERSELAQDLAEETQAGGRVQ
jgi:hypothetical protein